ncbi:hypothetical protein [Pseudemcibacter aquimaris]|uniref:hypothetical protein n=1 Tax=Pseudemcibacter aquimaris TaxID=2857064 RepID=UPI002011D494|nr:hypothetical protein [Pseudemcibacter aquimaris]MCC3860011.1 hypothetical protein [Pseudemcibacter aquimaris]WDU57341.1 hypothetical protein KW060_09035 [Pseudemcibacter aquimaris]
MPNENRDIFFTEHELKQALTGFAARKGAKFKVENINDFLVNHKALAIAMKVFDPTVQKEGTIKFTNPEIAAAMMGYCMQLKIPLPRSGKKSLQTDGKELFLNIKVS